MPSFRGFPACDCLVEWLPWVEKLLLHRKIIARNIDIYQLIGGASASAGTHRTGGAFDVAQATWGALQVYRAAGADASWRRTPAQGFTVCCVVVPTTPRPAIRSPPWTTTGTG
jgi:hypothetical protein